MNFNKISAWTAIALAVAGCVPNKPAMTAAPSDTPIVAMNAPKPAEPAPDPKPTVTPDAVSIAGGMASGKLYFPTGDPSNSALLLEKSIPAEIMAGKPFDYEIKVSNVSKMRLEGIEVRETVPSSFKIKDVTEGTADGKPNSVSYAVGQLEPGQSKVMRLQGTALQAGLMPTCLSARYNAALCMASNVVAPALKLQLAGPTDSLICDPLSYKANITNSGSGTAKNVKVEAILPEGLSTQDGKSSVAFNAGTLNAGESRDFTFTAKPAKTGSYALKATAKADEGLMSESDTLKVAVKQPVLQITKTGTDKAFLGQPFSYEITVTNAGDGVAKNVTIYDNYPAGVSIQGDSEKTAKLDASGKVRWDIGDLAPAASKKVSIILTANTAGQLKTAASVSAACAETKAAAAETALVGVPAILMEVVDDPDPIRVGGQTTYTIQITNQGTAPGTNIKLVCELEDPISFVSATGETKETVDGKSITFAPIGVLAPKAKSIYKVVVKAEKEGDVRFKAEITSDQFIRKIEKAEATTVYK